MTQLKLIALDDEDLTVISATMQDAIFKVEGLEFDHKSGQFLLAANRFVWEGKGDERSHDHERRRVNVAFKRVRGVKTRGINLKYNNIVLSLLAIQFREKDEGPEGEIELVMSAEAGILLDVECIEVQLTDTGAAWEAKSKPHHNI
ncbi:MAG: DUF2948 family protein [Rhizobiaceae bacterium]|nr:DUF2948 family protein [Rhizobiaceae bacterium]